MIAQPLKRRLASRIAIVAVLGSLTAATAFAQSKPRPRATPAPPPPRGISIGGYAMVGGLHFTAAESFDAIVGSPSGTIFGGGVRIGLPFQMLFVDAGAWRYRGDGERVFVANDEIFRLGIPVTIAVTPIEISAGRAFRVRRVPKLTPYAAGGLTVLRYHETSAVSTASEEPNDTFTGYHAFGGAEYKITRWFGLAGEASWSTVPDAIGESGVSAAFNETDLGGATVRIKVTIGR